MEATPTSHIPAHDFTATVAPFRAWRSLQLIIARGPIGATTAKARALLTDLTLIASEQWTIAHGITASLVAYTIRVRNGLLWSGRNRSLKKRQQSQPSGYFWMRKNPTQMAAKQFRSIKKTGQRCVPVLSAALFKK